MAAAVHAARTRVLLELSPEAIRSVTAGVVANCFLRVVTQIIPRAIALEETRECYMRSRHIMYLCLFSKYMTLSNVT